MYAPASTGSRHLAAVALALWLAACGGGGGGGGSSAPPPPPPPASTFTDPLIYSSAPGASLANPNELSSITQHQLVLGGVPIAYTATAGHLTATQLTSGAPSASFFYIAYTRDGANAATRPVTFFYNGGPGSSSVWLHLGSFGPKRLVTDAPSITTPTPFALVDNAESMLDISDLVFVDAVGTGFSQAIAPNTNQDFWGVDADAAVFRDFVRRYIAANNRGASPKFLFGESYGAPRTAILARLLETAGVRLHGLVLQSSALNYNSNCGVVELTISCGGYLPAYSATGAWHGLVTPAQAPAQLPAFLEQSRTLATTRYDPAVRSFLVNGVLPAPDLLTQLFDFTGMPVANWQSRFNLPPGYFQTTLRPGMLLGRYDSRFAVPAGGNLASGGDPSSSFISSWFGHGINDYLVSVLRFTTPSRYTTFTNVIINNWNFSHDGLEVPDTIPDLGAALALNPRLKVLSVSGYHDLATPFFQTELDLARLGPLPNIQTRNYEGGHMTYLDDGTRVLQKADLVQFYQMAVQP